MDVEAVGVCADEEAVDDGGGCWENRAEDEVVGGEAYDCGLMVTNW